MGLYENLMAIENAIVSAIWTDLSSQINGILIDQRIKQGNNVPPYIHIFEESGDTSDETLSLGEEWTLKITVMAVVASYAVEDVTKAKELSLKASGALIKDRTLGGTVSDTVRTAWHPNYTKELKSGQFFGAAVDLEIRFINREE
jgi:hypothetical protein